MKTFSRSFTVLYRTAACLAFAVAAPPAIAEIPCNAVSFTATPSQSIHIARIKPGQHATFISGYDNCPNDTPACRQKSYVIPGDLVLTSITHGPYTCAYYMSTKAEAAGWLSTTQLKQQANAKTPRTAWLATWRHGDSTINITASARNMAIVGEAFWPSKSDPDGHEGHMNGQAIVANARLSYSDPNDDQGCKLTATLVAQFLVARDNNKCGGANVSFSGVYIR